MEIERTLGKNGPFQVAAAAFDILTPSRTGGFRCVAAAQWFAAFGCGTVLFHRIMPLNRFQNKPALSRRVRSIARS